MKIFRHYFYSIITKILQLFNRWTLKIVRCDISWAVLENHASKQSTLWLVETKVNNEKSKSLEVKITQDLKLFL
jgi:aryl-phospho-beta-D-glucosidase BglC (GH1 family)